MSEKVDDVLTQWEKIRVLIESIDLDVRKNARGNAAAGGRARKGLRSLKNRSTELIKSTISEEKRRKAEKLND